MQNVFGCPKDKIALQIFLILATTNFLSHCDGVKTFPDRILEIKSVNPISFPAKCLIVKLKGNNRSTYLVNLLWYLEFTWFAERVESRTL